MIAATGLVIFPKPDPIKSSNFSDPVTLKFDGWHKKKQKGTSPMHLEAMCVIP